VLAERAVPGNDAGAEFERRASESLRFGYVLPNSWGIARLADVTRLAVDAEALGVDALWVSHHVLHVGFVQERLGTLPYHDPLVTLALVADATTRVQLGVSVLVVPYLHPVPTAKTVATIDQLSGGRVVLGVGVGGLRVEHDAVGQVPFEQRGRYADEFLDVVRLLWSGERGSYHGAFFSMDDVAAHPVPARPVGRRIMVGGGSDAALRRAARHDGWHGIGIEPPEVEQFRARLAQERERAGRDQAPFDVQIRLHHRIDDDDPSVWRDRLAAYAAAGVDEVLLAPQSTELDRHRQWLETVVPGVVQEISVQEISAQETRR
jgi:probable F420-dependent oxidoreductase